MNEESRLRQTMVTLAVAFSCWAVFATAALAAEPRVVFEEEAKIKTSCSALKEKGVPIKISNQLADDAVKKVIVGFDLTDDDDGEDVKTDEVCGGLTASPSEFELTAGGSKVVALTATESEGEGTASGSIVVRDESGRVVRRALSVSGEAEASKVTLLASDVTVDFGSGEKPIWVPVGGSRKDVVEQLGKKLRKSPTVGAVFGNGEPFPILYGGVRKMGPEASKVKLELDRDAGDPSAGTYSGKADLTPDVEGGDVTLEIKMSDCIWWAIGLLLAGIILGIYVQWVGGTSMPRARLLARINNLESRAKAASIEVTKAAQGKKWGAIAIGNVTQLEEDLRKKVEETTLGKRMVQIDKAVVESNDTAIAAVEDQIELLRDYPDHAQGLQASLDVPQAKVPDLESGQPQRKLETEAGKLLAAGSVEADRLKSRLEQMDLRAQQILSLRELEGWLKELWLEVEGFERLAPTNKDVDTVQEVLREVWHRLSTADEAEELEEALDLLRRARNELLPLRVSLGAATTKTTWVGRRGLVDALATRIATMGLESAASEAHPAAPKEPPPPLPLTKDEANRMIATARGFQWGVVFISAALAMVTGLLALYIGKTWGLDNPVDVLTAVTWGAATQAVLTTLIASWNDLSSLQGLLRR